MADTDLGPPLPEKTRVKLKQVILGVGPDMTGTIVDYYQEAGTVVLIHKHIQQTESNNGPRTSSNLDPPPKKCWTYSFKKLEAKPWRNGYKAEEGDTVAVGQLISHGSISLSLNGPVSATPISKEQMVFVVIPHEYTGGSDRHGKHTLKKGTRIFLTSNLLSIRGTAIRSRSTTRLSDGAYTFKIAVENMGDRVWSSKYHHRPDSFEVLPNKGAGM